MSSFLDKDEDDFVDEPLSSPRLHVRELDAQGDAQQFEDPELMVPPLSPTKPKSTLAADEAESGDAAKPEEAPTEELADLSVAEKDSTPATDEPDQPAGSEQSEQSDAPILTPTTPEPEEPATHEDSNPAEDPHKEEISSPERLSPHPEDTPAPLFSRPTAPAEPAPAEPAPTQVPEPDAQADPLEPVSGAGVEGLPNPEQDPSSASIIVDSATRNEDDQSIAQTPPAQKSYITPVVGDYLKIQFVDHRVVPTILEFFFKYPWNNFLHNVVYDIVQQVFNGPMDRGYNPTLAISLFEAADITAQIIKGQQASEASQEKSRTRMGYMGHLTLIAEEVVKFTERHPPELLSEIVVEKVMAHDWINYVEGALAETRERDNAILGGVRPEIAVRATAPGPRAWPASVCRVSARSVSEAVAVAPMLLLRPALMEARISRINLAEMASGHLPSARGR